MTFFNCVTPPTKISLQFQLLNINCFSLGSINFIQFSSSSSSSSSSLDSATVALFPAAMSSSGAKDGPSSYHFETPLLDAELPSLLHSICEHGGYAYISMATLAAAGDSHAAEAASEMAWEQLHSGPWHSVLPIWRDAYSMACLYLARFHFAGGDFKEALRVLDMGVIMGGPLLRSDLDSAIAKVSAAARVVRVLDVAEKDDQLEPPLGCEERNNEVRFVSFN